MDLGYTTALQQARSDGSDCTQSSGLALVSDRCISVLMQWH